MHMQPVVIECSGLNHHTSHPTRGVCAMSERIDQFCESLRVKLTHIDENLQGLKAKIDTEAKDADQVVRTHLASVKKRIEQGRAKATAAQNDMKKWLDERKATTDE